jgi:hypothetical protein
MYNKLSSAIRSLYVSFDFIRFFLYDFLLVPNDEDDNEDGDAVFMPIKSNDDDEPVGFKKKKKINDYNSLFNRLMIIPFGQNHVILLVKVL